MKKHIYIDCQSFQTEAWDRGMGRYTMSLLQAMYLEDDKAEYTLIFSSILPKNKPAIEYLEQTLPTATIIILPLEQSNEDGYKESAKHNKAVLNEFINDADHESVPFFIIPSLFQEPTASVFPDNAQRAVIYYDAIPFLYYERYKDAINYKAYMERYKTLYEADTIFTISQTIADDLLIYFGIANNKNRNIVNIDGACNEDMFVNTLRPKSAPKGEYILLPSSSDIRKNNRSAVRAFEQLRLLTNKDYKLVITSTFNKSQREQLSTDSSNIIFTGNISENELAWLYENAKVVLFTSEYEGLGLPVLESVRANKPVACSNLAVFREISEDAFYFFDPLDVQEITYSLNQAIEAKTWKSKHKDYKAIDTKYRWNRSAKLVLSEINKTSIKKENHGIVKPKIAIVGPVTGGYSAIGKVIQEMHDVTSQVFEIDYYLEDNKRQNKVSIRPDLLSYLANCFSVTDFNAKVYAQYDSVFYHIGNSEYHFYTILNALYLPGITIFHDTSLKEAFGEMVRLGFIGLDRHSAEAELDKLSAAHNYAYLGSVANNSSAIMVHSTYALKALKSAVLKGGADVTKAELPTTVPARNVYLQNRHKVHVGLAGVLTGNKGLDIITEIALNNSIADDIVLHVFGFSVVEPEIVEQLSLLKNVKLMTNLSDRAYQAQLANLDILVNFRTEYRGETSLTVLEAMRYGCVAIVNGELGWFSELPDNTVKKISDKSEMVASITQLVHDPKLRCEIAESARTYINKEHSPKEYVDLMHHETKIKVATKIINKKNAFMNTHTLDGVISFLNKDGDVTSE